MQIWTSCVKVVVLTRPPLAMCAQVDLAMICSMCVACVECCLKHPIHLVLNFCD